MNDIWKGQKMTDQNHSDNSIKAKKSSSTYLIIISFTILIAAVGMGIIIREIRKDSIDTEYVELFDEDQSIDTPEESTEVVYTVPPVIEEIPEPFVEVEEPAYEEPEPVYEEPEPVDDRRTFTLTDQQRQDATQWMTWLETLSPEERTALLRGTVMSFMQLMQRWQYMPAEEVMQERVFLQTLIQEWRDLPPEDRQRGIENIQYQLEQRLQYGQQY